MSNIFPNMPHSTVSEPMFSELSIVEDDLIPNAPELVPDPVKDEDMDDDTSYSETPTAKFSGKDVKLEDLFNDVAEDEDDEFSGSGVSNKNNESSPPEAPL